jgi:hypothetical protein
MRKICFIGVLVLMQFNSISQNLDLVVNHLGDSIACRIDSITDKQIYFEMKSNYKWIHTFYDISNITEYKRNVINKDLYKFKPGTSYIESLAMRSSFYSSDNLRNSSPQELNLYLNLALKQKKNSIILSIAGSAIAIAGYAIVNAHFDFSPESGDDFWLGTGGIMMLGGGVTTVVGLAKLSVSSSRINKIEDIKTGSSEIVYMEISPCAQYDLNTQNYVPGIKFNIRFKVRKVKVLLVNAVNLMS